MSSLFFVVSLHPVTIIIVALIIITLKEETEAEIRALENSIIEFLNDTEECETTDKKGKPIRQYIGTDYKATYSMQTRENVKKEEVKKLLTDKQYEQCIFKSSFGVLRIK